MKVPTIRLLTLGCKVNQCDSDEIAHSLAARGYHVAGRDGPADIFIVNTCTVTATADAKARKLIRRLHRQHPQAPIIVTGCLAQRDPESVALLPGVSSVVSNWDKPSIPHLLPTISSPLSPLASPSTRTRAFLKIQDGCDHHCAYCVVPRARGRPVSKPLSQVLGEMQNLAAAGLQEAVLCGIRLGAYGRDRGDGGLAALLHELRGTAIPRLRLSSLEPMDATEDLLAEIAGHPRLCHHLHLPLQSGDDAVLSAMGRGYTRKDFADLVLRLRRIWPDAAISTDVMVAFPGETDEQFQHTADFLYDMAFSRVHVFPYSRRPATPAASRPDQIPASIAHRRTQHMLTVARDLMRAAARRSLGQKVSVLFEERDKNGHLTGLTEHYLRVHCPGPDSLTGRVAEVVPRRESQGDLVAELWGPVQRSDGRDSCRNEVGAEERCSPIVTPRWTSG